MRSLLALALLSLSGAAWSAGLQYVESSGVVRVASRTDYYDEYDSNADYSIVDYDLSSSPPSLNQNVFSDTLTGGTPGDFGNRASGTFSGLADTSGFSFSGAVENWGSRPSHCNGYPEVCTKEGTLQRIVIIELTEADTLYFNTDWSDTNRSGGAIAFGDMRVQKKQNEFFWESPVLHQGFSAADGPVSGGSLSDSVYLEAGTYRIMIDMKAQKSTFGPSSTASQATGTFSVSVVPIPAAVWLFGSALAGLGWFRRRTT